MPLFIPTLFRYMRLNRLIRKIDKTENIFGNFGTMYGSEFKRDWIGRWYTVLNPLVQNMGDYSGSDRRVFEFTENGLSEKTYVENWCMDRMFAASNFIRNKELLDILTYSIEKIDENQNYLFILKPILFDDLKKCFKRFSLVSLILVLVLVVSLIFA